MEGDTVMVHEGRRTQAVVQLRATHMCAEGGGTMLAVAQRATDRDDRQGSSPRRAGGQQRVRVRVRIGGERQDQLLATWWQLGPAAAGCRERVQGVGEARRVGARRRIDRSKSHTGAAWCGVERGKTLWCGSAQVFAGQKARAWWGRSGWVAGRDGVRCTVRMGAKGGHRT